MKKKNRVPRPLENFLGSPFLNFYWGGLAAATWIGVQFWHVQKGTPFSFLVLFKGLLLLILATLAYQVSVFAKGFSFLGLYPLLWLSVSRFQWNLCTGEDFYAWLWLVSFLLTEILIFVIPDGKKLIQVLTPFWAVMAWFFPFSLGLPFSFVTAPKGRFKNHAWVKRGGVAVGFILFLLFRGWRFLGFDWTESYSLLITDFYLGFFFLGCLGFMAFPKKGIFRQAAFPLFLLVLGFLFFQPLSPSPGGFEVYRWFLVFFSGFGWESFRRDLMDPSWHARLLWAAMGVFFFGGVI